MDITERVATLEQKCVTQEKNNQKMSEDIKDIKDRLLGRPSWIVTIIISSLTTISTSLIVFITVSN